MFVARLVSLSLVQPKARRRPGKGEHTRVGSKGSDGLFSLRLRVKPPCLICLLVRSSTAPERDFVLSNNGLAVENKKGGDSKLVPKVKVLADMDLDSRQAAECGKQWLVSRLRVQKKAQVVRGIDGDGAIFELGNFVCANRSAISIRPSRR